MDWVDMADTLQCQAPAITAMHQESVESVESLESAVDILVLEMLVSLDMLQMLLDMVHGRPTNMAFRDTK